MDEFLNEIDAFRQQHGLSEWQFGEMALNDRHFIRQLRTGRDMRLSTFGKVRAFMESYQPAPSSEAAA